MPSLINLSRMLLLSAFGLAALYAFYSNLKTLQQLPRTPQVCRSAFRMG